MSSNVKGSRPNDRVEVWKPPPFGPYKINVDGSFPRINNSGSTSFVIRDALGIFIAGGGTSDSCFLFAEHVEAVECKQAIQFAVDNNFWPAIIETDAQVVYLQLLNNSSVNLSILGTV
ncbi:hypothetical protein ACLB2K_014856 [Fragaria x ananassa]